MKRSEMIDLISKSIQQEIGGHYTSFTEHAEKALEACEKAGMLPPLIHWSKTKQQDPDYNSFVNYWEDEIDCGAV